MTSNSMVMPNTNSTTNNSSQISEIVCTPTILFPTFQALDARQTLSGFLPVCNNQQPTQQQQQIGKFTKTQQKNQIKTVDSLSSNQLLTNQLVSSNINSSTLTNHTITIQHQPVQSNHLMQSGQKFQGTTIMIPTNSNQMKTSHLNNNGELVWSCPSCKLPCKTASELQNHLNVHTKTEKSVPCDQCGKLFVSQERVKIHIKVSHGVKSSVCPICNSSFTYKCKLADHMRTHTGDKPFQCDICQRRFKQKSHVSRHKMIHTGEKPFLCEVCNKGFYRKDKLSRHRLIHLNPSSRKSKQQGQITNNDNQLNNNNESNNNNTSSMNSLNAITNGSIITNNLINNSNALNNNSLFQTTNSSNDNLINSNTATIQLIPVQLTQQWIAAQNNLNPNSISNLNSINNLNNNLNNNSNQQETMNSNNNNSNNNPMNSNNNCT